jgi:hypothetical protein
MFVGGFGSWPLADCSPRCQLGFGANLFFSCPVHMACVFHKPVVIPTRRTPPSPQGYNYLVRFLDPPGPEEVARAEGGPTIAAWLETVCRKGLRAEFEAWADVLDGRVAGGMRRSGLGAGPGSRSRLHTHVSIFVCGARGFMSCAHVHARALRSLGLPKDQRGQDRSGTP